MNKRIITGVLVIMMILSTSNVKAVSKKTIKNYTKNYMLLKYEWGADEFKSLNKVIMHESSWNYKAVNKKSGACGLFQALPCRKMRSAGKNYRKSYKVQVKWGLKYIKNRYGTPSNAWRFWQKHHWY